MAIIKRKRGNVIYVYDIAYIGFKDGKRKYEAKCLGHIEQDENGKEVLVPSKKNRRKAIRKAPLIIKTTTAEDLVREKKAPKKSKAKKKDSEKPQKPQKTQGTQKTQEPQEKKPIKAALVKVKNYISTNTKPNNIIFGKNKRAQKARDALYSGREIAVVVQGKQSKKEILVYATAYVKDENGKIQQALKELTPFDRAVHDAMLTTYVIGGNEYVTVNHIYQIISGNLGDTSENHVPPKMHEAIVTSAKNLGMTWIKIDAREQAEAYANKKRFQGVDASKAQYEGPLVMNEMVHNIIINGQEVSCIHIGSIPVLYRYADDISQVIRNPLSLLNVRVIDSEGKERVLENTQENITLKTFLLQQISIMERNAVYSRTILYDTIYELLGVDTTQLTDATDAALRMRKKEIRDKVKLCLDCWTGKKIQGYTEEKVGNTIAKVTIEFPEVKILDEK